MKTGRAQRPAGFFMPEGVKGSRSRNFKGGPMVGEWLGLGNFAPGSPFFLNPRGLHPFQKVLMSVVPYRDQRDSKKSQVAQMFNSIAHRYDFLNHFLSAGIDRYWRRRAIDELVAAKPRRILDVATGTADLAIAALRADPEHITGVDISEGMLSVGRQKLTERHLTDRITLLQGDSEALDFADNSFDAIMAAYGVRNFEHLDKGLAEMYRVLKPGGKLVVLEFSKPRAFPLKQLYNGYFKFILPTVGKMISQDRAAYSYLPESVQAFPDGENFLQHLRLVGFTAPKWKPLTFGISSIYTASK
jgi:demethylmenaquinone methyltransferase / 2-methoxy-6-polyprenyl-1,4-benzoquinol methylase